MNGDTEYTGYDASGYPRVYGTGFGRQQAADNCLKAAQEYIVRRPDTGPLSKWRFDLTDESE